MNQNNMALIGDIIIIIIIIISSGNDVASHIYF